MSSNVRLDAAPRALPVTTSDQRRFMNLEGFLGRGGRQEVRDTLEWLSQRGGEDRLVGEREGMFNWRRIDGSDSGYRLTVPARELQPETQSIGGREITLDMEFGRGGLVTLTHRAVFEGHSEREAVETASRRETVLGFNRLLAVTTTRTMEKAVQTVVKNRLKDRNRERLTERLRTRVAESSLETSCPI